MKPLSLLQDFGLTILLGFAGSTVALAYLPGLTWRQQLAATLAGGLTASVVSWGVQDWLHLSSAAAGGVSFVVGLLAFRATPAAMKGVAASFERLPDYAGQLVGAITDKIRSLGGKA